MNNNYDAVCLERNQVIKQYEYSETLWKDKLEKKQNETEQILKLHESLKDDHKEAMI